MPSSLKDQVFRLLTSSGSRLTVAQIAERLGVAERPVANELETLRQEGSVEVKLGRWFTRTAASTESSL